MKPSDVDLDQARAALRRGADPGSTIPHCSCFFGDRPRNGKMCNGVCEDAAVWVAKAIAQAREDGKKFRERVANVRRDGT